MGPTALEVHEDVQGKLNAARDAAAQRQWIAGLEAFEKELEAFGVAGWCPSLHAVYGSDGYRRPTLRLDVQPSVLSGASWLPIPYRHDPEAPTRQQWDRQFSRWELVDQAERLGLAEESEVLRHPCPEDDRKARRAWYAVANDVRAAMEEADHAAAMEEAARAEKAAERADEESARMARSPFAVLKGRF